jgi:hypothetical protein
MTGLRLCCLSARAEAERHRLRAAALDDQLDRVQRALEAAEKRLAIRGKGGTHQATTQQIMDARLLESEGEPV